MSGLGQKDGKAGTEKWSYARCTLKVELSIFADGLERIVRKIKEISPEYSLEGLMLKLKLQYLGHLIQRTD